MPKFVKYDPTITGRPSPVTWLFDADVISYPNLPPPEQLFEVSDADWRNLAAPWAISNGALITFAPPPPPMSPAQEAAVEVQHRIGAGLTLSCTGDPALSATYALDRTTMDQIGSVARDVAAGLGFPDGETFEYPDAAGLPHVFTPERLIGLYKAQRQVLSRINTQAAVLANGGVPSWPDQTATID